MNPTDVVEFRCGVLGQLRRASDRVRLALIPDALTHAIDVRNALARFNQAYFEEGVFGGEMAGDADRINYENRQTDSAFYDTNIADLQGLRTTRIHAVGLELIHPAFLSVLASWYFERLDRSQDLDPERFFEFLTTSDIVYRLTHFPKNGTGRAGEDLRVYLAARNDFDLSSSASSYRSALEGRERPLFFRKAAQRIFNRELIARAYAYAGRRPPQQFSIRIRDVLSGFGRGATAYSDACWPSEMIDVIDHWFEELCRASSLTDGVLQADYPYRIYAEFPAKEAIYILLCMDNPVAHFTGLTERFRLFASMHRIDHFQATRRRYLPTPPEIGEPCDELVARLERSRSEPGSLDGKDITRRIDEVAESAPDLAQLMQDERHYGPSDATLNGLTMALDGVTGEQVRAELERQLRLAETRR